MSSPYLEVMLCSREDDGKVHELTAPYMFFDGVSIIGRMTPQLRGMLEKFQQWWGGGENPNPNHHVFCTRDFQDLMTLMEKWRIGDPAVVALLGEWRGEGSSLRKSG